MYGIGFFASISDGRMVKVKTIKGFEPYGYYDKFLWVELANHKFANWGVNFDNPFMAIAIAEQKSVRELMAMPSFHPLK